MAEKLAKIDGAYANGIPSTFIVADAIEGVEGIVWGIFLNRGTVPCQNFLVGVGGRVKRNEGYPYVEKGKPSFVV